MVAPIVVFGLVDLTVAGGRVNDSQARVDSAAHAAARTATLYGTPAAAAAAARREAAASLGQARFSCQNMSVQTDTSGFRAGGTVRVVVSCDVAFTDLNFVPLPGSKTVSGDAVSVVDTYHETTP